MATGHGSVTLQYICTPCAKVQQNSEALFYCTNCGKHFCSFCQHQHEKLLDGHRVLGVDKKGQWGSVKSVFLPTCEEHHAKEMEMYCGDHDVVCCMICVQIKHKYVPVEF